MPPVVAGAFDFAPPFLAADLDGRILIDRPSTESWNGSRCQRKRSREGAEKAWLPRHCSSTRLFETESACSWPRLTARGKPHQRRRLWSYRVTCLLVPYRTVPYRTLTGPRGLTFQKFRSTGSAPCMLIFSVSVWAAVLTQRIVDRGYFRLRIWGQDRIMFSLES